MDCFQGPFLKKNILLLYHGWRTYAGRNIGFAFLSSVLIAACSTLKLMWWLILTIQTIVLINYHTVVTYINKLSQIYSRSNRNNGSPMLLTNHCLLFEVFLNNSTVNYFTWCGVRSQVRLTIYALKNIRRRLMFLLLNVWERRTSTHLAGWLLINR